MKKEENGLDGKNRENQIMIERDELKEEFVRIFALYNKFGMPIDIAWIKFKNIVENTNDTITPDDTEKIASLCVNVKKAYYENDRGIITDKDGNPDIKANIENDKEFLENNEDIAIVLEEKGTEKISESEKRIETFFETYLKLSVEEKENTFNFDKENALKNAEKRENERKNDRKSREIIEKVKRGEKLTEEEKARFEKDKKNTANFKALKLIDKYSKGEDVDRDLVIKLALVLFERGNEAEKKVALEMLSNMKVISKGNKSHIESKCLNALSGEKKGSYKSVDEVIAEVDSIVEDEMIQMGRGVDAEIKDNEIHNVNNNVREMQITSHSKLVYEKLNSDYEKSIYSQLQKVDLMNNNDNALYLIHLKMYFEKIPLNKLDDNQQLKVNSMINVLNEMILNKENTSIFGDYIDEGEINYEKVKLEISKQGDFTNPLEHAANDFIMERKYLGVAYDEDRGIRDIVYSFSRIEKNKIALIDKKQLLESVIRISEGKEEVSVRELERLENLLIKSEDFSFLFENEELNVDKAKEFQKLLSIDEIEEKRLTDLKDVISKFTMIDIKSTSDDKKYLDKEKFIEEKFGTKEKTDEYDEKYKEYLHKYSLRKSFNNVYSNYLNRRDYDELSTIEKKKYVTSLMYLYEQGDENYKEFAETFIKRNFGKVVLDAEGKIDRGEFVNLYKSYEIGGKDTNNVQLTMNAMIKSNSRSFERRLKEKDSTTLLKSLEYEPDIKTILSTIQERDDTRKLEEFIPPKEKEILDLLNNKIDLTKESSVVSLVTTYNVLKDTEKNINEYKHIVKAIEGFASKIENRKYFAKYLNMERINGQKEKIDPDIAKVLELDDIEEIKSFIKGQAKKEAKNVNTQEVIGRIASLKKKANVQEFDDERFEKVVESIEKTKDNKFSQLFIKDGKVDIDRIEAFVEAIPDVVKNDKEVRKIFLRDMTTKFEDPDTLKNYKGKFERFLKDFKKNDVKRIRQAKKDIDTKRLESIPSRRKITDKEFEENTAAVEMNTSILEESKEASQEKPIQDKEIESQKQEEMITSAITDDTVKEKKEIKVEEMVTDDVSKATDSPIINNEMPQKDEEEVDSDGKKEEQEDKKDYGESEKIENNTEEPNSSKPDTNPFVNIANSVKGFISRITTPKLTDGSEKVKNEEPQNGFLANILNKLKGTKEEKDAKNSSSLEAEQAKQESSFVPQYKIDEKAAVAKTRRAEELAKSANGEGTIRKEEEQK